MAIRSRNKVEPTFNSSSMSDLVFLLLIFFILTSTLVAPNAINLLLPSSKSENRVKQTIAVYVNEQNQYQVNDTPATDETQLYELIKTEIGAESEATIVLKSDKNVPVQYIVNVIDAVNTLNKDMGLNHKVVLATSQKNQETSR